MLNTAARIVTLTMKHEHIIPILQAPHVNCCVTNSFQTIIDHFQSSSWSSSRLCKYMIFYTKKKNVQSLTLKIDDIIIERVAEFIFLGLNIDEHLTWKCHINKISNKISQCMGILNRLNRFHRIKSKVIYNSVEVSHLNFGLLIWSFKYEKNQ